MDQLQEQLKFIADALKPMADAVFNDNGDLTIEPPTLTSADFVKAYTAEKVVQTLLSNQIATLNDENARLRKD